MPSCRTCDFELTIWPVSRLRQAALARLAIVESLRNSSIELVITCHEQGAAFMAATYGRLTGKPGVCIATRPAEPASDGRAGHALAPQGDDLFLSGGSVCLNSVSV